MSASFSANILPEGPDILSFKRIAEQIYSMLADDDTQTD
jgi:hypothetical protein